MDCALIVAKILSQLVNNKCFVLSSKIALSHFFTYLKIGIS